MPDNRNIRCKLGLYDIPEIQMQPWFDIDLTESNIAIFGTAMSGKTNVIKLLINSLHRKRNVDNEKIFILDFSGALKEYEQWPLVGAYYDNSNEEYVKRVFKILDTILKENIKKLGSGNYKTSEEEICHTTFIVDNLNAFVDEERYGTYQEKFGRLARDGRARGISIVFTATDTKGINKYLLSFEQKIGLNLSTEKYSDLYGCKTDALVGIPGRGYANVTQRPDGITGSFDMNKPYEVQLFIANDINDAKLEGELHSKYEFNSISGKYNKRTMKYQSFPPELDKVTYKQLLENDSFPGYRQGDSYVSVGLDYVDFKPVGVDVKQIRQIAIYGKKEFGKTNMLNLLMDGILKKRPDYKVVLFDDGRKQLEELNVRCMDNGHNCQYISAFKEVDGIKLSPLQQFYKLIHEQYMDLSAVDYINDELSKIYGGSGSSIPSFESFDMDDYGGGSVSIPQGADRTVKNPTVFVIQSKSLYVYVKHGIAENLMLNILPQLFDIAEDNDYIFIFSDVQKITDAGMRDVFNSSIKMIFLLDNIAEFASERGSRTVFGDMDIKMLKDEYAKCERGDGYCYDVESDSLKKSKFIKYED